MTIIVGGTDVEKVFFNGVDCGKVYFNGELVFEKVLTPMITVVQLDHNWYGYSSDREAGALVPNTLEGFNGYIESVIWIMDPNNGPSYAIIVSLVGNNFPDRLRLTIGTQSFDLQYPYSGNYMVYFGKPQWDALPKSGTHPIIVEVL